MKNFHPSHQPWPTRFGPSYPLHSNLAKIIKHHQNNCSLSPVLYNLDHAGLGSDLHVYSQNLAQKITQNQRLVTNYEDYFFWSWPILKWFFRWRWLSQSHCPMTEGLGCYFISENQAETKCRNFYTSSSSKNVNSFSPSFLKYQFRNSEFCVGCRQADMSNLDSSTQIIYDTACCQATTSSKVDELFRKGVTRELNPNIKMYRAAFMEYLFSEGLSEIVKQEVILQMQMVFGTLKFPENLITVHIRWGK